MMWATRHDTRHPRRWIITRDGFEVGSFWLSGDMFDPEAVMGALVEALEQDTKVGAFNE